MLGVIPKSLDSGAPLESLKKTPEVAILLVEVTHGGCKVFVKLVFFTG